MARLQGLAAQLEDDLAAASAAPGGGGPVAKQPGTNVAAAARDMLAAAAGEAPLCARAACWCPPASVLLLRCEGPQQMASKLWHVN